MSAQGCGTTPAVRNPFGTPPAAWAGMNFNMVGAGVKLAVTGPATSASDRRAP